MIYSFSFLLAATATDVLRQQSDGTWRVIIDNLWETD